MIGGRAGDLLTGGEGSDRFEIDRISTVPDRITDFLIGTDVLVLDDGLGATLDELFVVGQNGSFEVRVTSDDTPGGTTIVVLDGIPTTSVGQLLGADSLIVE